jgi:hypothetical protein
VRTEGGIVVLVGLAIRAAAPAAAASTASLRDGSVVV